MFSRLHAWTDIIDNICFLTLTSFANPFSLSSDVCKMFNAKVENDGKTLLIDVTGNVQFLVLTSIANTFLSSGVCEILETDSRELWYYTILHSDKYYSLS